jgi:nucleotide-binding universal stress UspA family protein
MNTIIVATDYSTSAQNAAEYASEIASLLNAKILLIHGYILPFSYTDTSAPLMNIDEVQEIAYQSMDAEADRLRNIYPHIHINTRVEPGDILNLLKEEADTTSPLIIVMGGSTSSSDSVFWGSTTLKAMRTLKSPVLAVPQNVKWKKIESICLAADYDEDAVAKSPIENIIYWPKVLNAQLNIMHIDISVETKHLSDEVRKKLEVVNPEYYSIVASSLEEGVTKFLMAHPTDWIMVVPKQYGFFANLFHKSNTKILADISNVPILALKQVVR